jgi:hypothetical protein
VNKDIYKSLSKEERDNSELGGRLLELIKQQDAEYKKLHKDIGNTSVNVGNYEEAIKSAMEGMDVFSGGADDMLKRFISISQQEGGVKSFFKTFVSGIGTATKAGLVFIATPIGVVIAAIVAGISLFTGAISRNQSASDKFQRVWSGIKNVFDEIIGRVFKLAKAFTQLLSFDFAGALNSAREATAGFTKSLMDAYNAGQKLAEMQQSLEKASIVAITNQAELNKQAEKQRTIQDDTTRSFKEREAAASRLRDIESKMVKENIDLAKQEYEIARLQVVEALKHGKIKNELLTQAAEAEAKYLSMQTEEIKQVGENERTRRELIQDRLERDLDILIDGYDNQKTINERIISDDKKTFEEREKLLEETRRLGEQSFQKQIETIQQFTGEAVNANALLAESDAEVLNAKIRELGLSEIIEGRLLEVIRERRTATQDLADLQKDLAEQHTQFQVDMAEKELDIYIAKNQSKIDSETALTAAVMAQEQSRLQSIYDKEIEFLTKERDAKLITEQDFQLRKIELQNQFIEQEKELKIAYRDYQLEQDQTNFEMDLEIKAIRGESEYQIQAAQLEREYLLKKQAGERDGTWSVKNEQYFAEKRKAITKAENENRLLLYSQTFGNIASILGENTKAGKAASIAQATIDTYQAANAAYKAMAAIPVVGPALGAVAAAAAIVAGIKNVKKIISTKTDVPKAEHGAVIDIGGKRHSAGGTRFYGSDGTQFEAERGEKMFILNRMASQAYGPALSRLNQMFGGRSLMQSSNYLANGGSVSRAVGTGSTVNVPGIDYDLLASKVAEKMGDRFDAGIARLPNPVTDVKDIIDEVSKYNKVINGASF